MPSIKRSISFDAELLTKAEAVARIETEGNLSALVGEALEDRLKHSKLRQLVEEDRRQYGPIPPEARAEMDAQWPWRD